jgi:hypothetical protein
MFENIQAAAPCLGALAAAFAWVEMLNYSEGELQIISGGAYAWSPLQPIQRDIVLLMEVPIQTERAQGTTPKGEPSAEISAAPPLFSTS